MAEDGERSGSRRGGLEVPAHYRLAKAQEREKYVTGEGAPGLKPGLDQGAQAVEEFTTAEFICWWSRRQ